MINPLTMTSTLGAASSEIDPFGDFMLEPLPAQDLVYALTLTMDGFSSRQENVRTVEAGTSMCEVELAQTT